MTVKIRDRVWNMKNASDGGAIIEIYLGSIQ